MLHKKSISIILILTIILSLFALSLGSVSATITSIEEDREILKQQEDDYKNAKSQRKQIQGQINALINEQSTIVDQKNYVEYEIGYLIAEISALGNLIELYNKEIDSLQIEISNLNTDIDTYVELISDIIKYTYLEGEPSLIEMLLSAESLTGFLSKIEFASYMVNYNDKVLTELNSSLVALNDSKDEHEVAMQKLTSLRQDNDLLKDEYENKKLELEEKIKELQKNLSYAQSLYQQQQKAEAQIQKDIIKLQQQIKEKEIYTGNWARPLPYTCKRISSTYGNRFIFNSWEFHNGIDMPAPTGTQVFAVQTGTVIIAEHNRSSYGWYVVIDHGGGVSTLYGHCSKLLVSAGDKILKGGVVGLVGSTGRSTGPHLHLGLMINGSWSNPDAAGYFDSKGMGFIKDPGA